jgi:ELWxxDGT repeat protein
MLHAEKCRSVSGPCSTHWDNRARSGLLMEGLEGRQLLSVATLVQDLTPRDVGSNPQPFVTTGGLGYFIASETKSGNTSYWLYRTDGTGAGTTQLATFATNTPKNLTASGSLAYFESPDAVKQVWRTDGTAAGTIPLTTFTSATIATRNYTDVNGTIFFVVTGNVGSAELWQSGGTAASTGPVVNPARFASILSLTNVNGTLFFAAAPASDPTDVELWKTDGTDAGTVRVKDVAPGSVGSGPTGLINVNGTLYFLANDGVNGPGLWKSDGTDTGTALIKTDASIGHGTVIQSAVAVGNTLYYVASVGSFPKLFKSDGTAAGTGLVLDLVPGSSGNPTNLTAFGDTTLLFSATTPGSGRELWRSDGTAGGTVQVTELLPGSGSSSPANLVVSAAWSISAPTTASTALNFGKPTAPQRARPWPLTRYPAFQAAAPGVSPRWPARPRRAFCSRPTTEFTGSSRG